MRTLRITAALAIATFATACGDDDLTTFRVEIENVSPDNLIDSDRADGAMPLSAGLWALFDGDNPMFDPDENASRGLELLAEDGFPSAALAPEDPASDLLSEVEDDEDVILVDTFTSPGGPDDGPHLFPGERVTFTFEAEEGEQLQMVSMLVQSNDWFIAFDGDGLSLFDVFGDEIDGNVTDELTIYDAGTEVDQILGQGDDQPLNTPGEIDVGEVENADIEEFPFDEAVPNPEEFVRVIITPLGDND